MNLNKDLVIELMQCEISKLRNLVEEQEEFIQSRARASEQTLEKDLVDKTLNGSVLPPKFSQKGVNHE